MRGKRKLTAIAMDELAKRFASSLARGEPDLALLGTTGERDPAAAARSFARADRNPDLLPHRSTWITALLRTARPGFGAQCLDELAVRSREELGEALAPPSLLPLARVLGSSNFLARRLLRDPAAARGILDKGDDETEIADWPGMRRVKYAGLLRVAAADLAGQPFADGLRELSDLADRCLRAALAFSARECGAHAPVLFALGKLGGRELNYSSDVDLLFLDETPLDTDPGDEPRAATEVIRLFKRRLEEPTPEGFGYRVDLDLRPEGGTGVLANSVDAALAYYASFGAEWERQMLIRLRPVAGPPAIIEAFCEPIRLFVYRRSIDPGVLDAVRAMKDRIERERRDAGRDIEANLKEGPGGIRDIEFLIQSLQLFYGARTPSLQTGNVLDTLSALDRAGLLPESTTHELAESYTWLRRAEHAVQLVEEQQTAAFPRDPGEQIALARRMGHTDPDGRVARTRLLADWVRVREEVRGHFDALVLSRET